MSLKLTFDVQNKRLVSYNGSLAAIPPLYQDDTQLFQVQFVQADPTATFPATYEIVEYATQTLIVSLGATPTGTPGSPTPYITDSGWAWDGTDKVFNGSLDLSDADIATAIGANASATAYIQFQIDDGGDIETIYQGPVVLKAVV